MSGQGRGRGRGGGRGSGRSRGRGRGSRGRGRMGGGRGGNRGNGRQQEEHGRNGGRGRFKSQGSGASDGFNEAGVLKNGEKGADVFTVPEAKRIQLTRQLMEFREGDESTLEFSASLTNTERRFLHSLCTQLGLKSKSTGKGDNRRIVVTKPEENANKANSEIIPVLTIGKAGESTLEKYFKKFPATHEEELESRRTGDTLLEALRSSNDDEIAKALKPLAITRAKVIDKQFQERKVDLGKRRKWHEAAQQQKRSNSSYREMLKRRSELPAYAHQSQIADAVKNSPVTIIQGDTGCGKSTQVPQFILDANSTANIVVTQPRRISAISIAERVSEEQCLNEKVGGMIGYQVRLDSAVSQKTQLAFVTPGILLRKLQYSPSLSEYTHVIIDEIHERDRYTEFLLITIRDLLPKRPDLRLILMSATLQVEELYSYFADYDHPFYRENKPFRLELEGRMFPVQEFFLEKILRMTGYVDPLTQYDGGKCAPIADPDFEARINAAVTKNRQEEEENDAIHEGPTPTRNETKKRQCDFCGKSSFPSEVEFGIHVAICDGVNDDSDNSSKGYNENSELGAVRASGTEQLEEYDLEQDAWIDEEASLFSDKSETESEASAVDEEVKSSDLPAEEVKKWDGSSDFEAFSPNQSGGQEEKDNDEILARYQAVTDDEQIDNFLLLEVVQYIVKSSYGDGAILIFLPGWAEISEFLFLLETTAPFRDRSKYQVLPLHSGISSKEQRRVLVSPPKGTRKIILSTNIAETSLTIDDVAFVVDSGRAKEKGYDPHLKTSTLKPAWISKASCKQRKGRAGRTKPGVCFHLFSSRRFGSFRPFVESELLRTPLEEMCLLCKKMDLAPGGSEDEDGIAGFLAKAMSPPHEKSISNALELLVELEAMEPETNHLTNLGNCLSIMSLEPRVGRMVLWSFFLGCSRIVLGMATSMSYKSAFLIPPPSQRKASDRAKVLLSERSESDQFTAVNVLRGYDEIGGTGRAFFDFCRENMLNPSTVKMISDLRRNLTRELDLLTFPNPMTRNQFHNRNGNSRAVWEAAIAAGLYPNMATRRSGTTNFSTRANRKAKIHVSSVNASSGQPLSKKSQIPESDIETVFFGELAKGMGVFTMSSTSRLTSSLPLVLLCGASLSVRPNPDMPGHAILSLDDWVFLNCNAAIASKLVILRKRLNKSFHEALADPIACFRSMPKHQRELLQMIGPLLESAHTTATSHL